MKNLSYGPAELPTPGYSGFSFGIAQFTGEIKVEAKAGFHTCREGLLSKIASNLEEIKTDKTHMLLKWDAGSTTQLEKATVTTNNLTNQKWIENGVRLLHFYEKLAGWPLTKMHKVKTGHDESTKLYYFLSSRRWIKAPYLTSLYILLIRIGKYDYFNDFKTYKDLISVVEKLPNKTNLTTDERYIRNTFEHWKTIVTCYPDLFRKRKIGYYWSEDNLREDSYIEYEGISYISGGDTRNKTLYDKFMKLHEENK